ncbi:hypothetical protein LCGC14_0422500 [marine sediment metagenome]|uniref:Uncharacterized protein n=1 Tax=marine sediment metagenome TaxID=412755 RepID=A0A0F9T8B0_9ZZZZ
MTTDAGKKQLDADQDFDITDEMEAKMQARLDGVIKPDDADLEGVPRLEKKNDSKDDSKDDEKNDSKDDEKNDSKDDEKNDSKDDEKNDSKDDEKNDSKDDEDDEKVEYVLPENYFQAMRHVGWEPERIKEKFEEDPEQALKDFKFYHDSQNYITQQTSDLGRTQKAATERATEEAVKKEEKPEFKGVDLKAVEDEFGEDNPAAVAIIKAMNENNKVLYDEVQSLKEVRQQQQGPSDEQKVIWNTIVTHFDSDSMKGFGEFYGKTESGKNWDQSLTGAQLQARMNVIHEADAYHAGMKLQGKDVEFSGALNRAHLVISAPIQETILREQLHGKIRKRSKGITVKSSGRKAVDDTSSKKKDTSEKGFIEKTKQRIKKITGRTPES